MGIILPRLPEGFRYTEISMDDEKQMLAISSTKKKEKKSDILMFFTFFEYFPKLIFQQVLEVCTEQVKIFKNYLHSIFPYYKYKKIPYRFENPCSEIQFVALK